MDQEKIGTPTTLRELEEKHKKQKQAPSTPERNQNLEYIGKRKEEHVQDEP
ncbi:hypothetical protein ACKE5C_02140 [Aneurinibacillus thermoaerophilus]|uniref:Uncharacterized protein n=1 Tax=Aneurinibacillus thermoaerophilus TaxID=143495 RepID=A0ABX8YCQ8_ANETH|nr:hypothetical protein [Aneurinibacillus thermoaerophilus]MED0675772.1 hypothetical protein [Aneurinibacillus thermoaerophilus]QYY43130.1 hypothetical protein K3F53_02120 [Aneurinibacillus thermoaerophilus]